MTTFGKYRSLKAAKWSLKSLAYGAPAIPAGVMIGLNWDEWVKEAGDGWSLGFGFASLLVSVIITYITIAKRKNILSHVSPLFGAAVIVACWAVSLLFLGKILTDLGYTLLAIAGGVLFGAACDETETRVVEKKVAFYKGLVDENRLDRRQEKRRLKEEKEAEKAKEEAAHQAVE